MPFLDLLPEVREQIREVAAAHGADRLRLFGSAARREDGPSSDLDFLASFAPGRSLLDLANLELQLEQLLERRVDVVTESGLRPVVLESALRDMVDV
jgi:uncharacterized protein